MMPASKPLLHEVVQRRALATPHRPAVVFLSNGEIGAETPLSYAELDRAARATAVAILRRARPGDRAMLLFPSGLEFVVACLGCHYAGVVAVPTAPPDPAPRAPDLPRLRRILENSGVALVLTTPAMRDAAVEALAGDAAEFS